MKPGDTIRIPRAPCGMNTREGTVLHIDGYGLAYVGFVIEHEDGDTYPMSIHRVDELTPKEPTVDDDLH